VAGSKQQAKLASDRRARVEAMRKEQAKKQRLITTLISAGGGVIVVVIVVIIIITAMNRHSAVGEQLLPSGADTAAAATTEPAATTIKNPTDIQGVVAYDTTGHGGTSVSSTDDGHGLPFNHVTGSVSYSVTPPVGGDHNGTWMNCGIYNSPVTTERAVHDLEHGAIWITYEPSLSKSAVGQLEGFVKKQKLVTPHVAGASAERFMDLTPWKDSSIGSPIVLSSWGFQLKVSSPTDPRLQQFVDAFRVNAKYTPEYGSACSGEPVNISGQPIST